MNEKRKFTYRKIRKIAKKLDKLKRKDDMIIAVSNELSNNDELIREIESYNIKILDGRWIFKFMLLDILEYISKSRNEILETISFAIIINNAEDIAISQIEEIAKRVKNIKIVTSNINQFSYLEEMLYIDYGIAMQITSNKEKALSGVDIIINYDLCEEKINEYRFPSYAIIVNIKYVSEIKSADFEGEVISNYRIEYENEDAYEFEGIQDFNENVFYESLIYRRDTFSNIRKQMDKDKVRISWLGVQGG